MNFISFFIFRRCCLDRGIVLIFFCCGVLGRSFRVNLKAVCCLVRR